jgi:hypothetical protein
MFKYIKHILMALVGNLPTVEVEKVEYKEVEKPTVVEVPVGCDCQAEMQKLVKNEAELRNRINSHEESLRIKKEELADANLAHKTAVEDTKHMQKKIDEQNELKLERAVFEAEVQANKDIDAIRKEYAKKLETELLAERKTMQDFMQKVMQALPNVNASLNVGTPPKQD